ncbi:metal ABC transporter solute-binding protein, Zn/Mn family [Litoribrevibacter albus]|nr:zinc ABC transporter substrate-binding protein [Litoribrevibacter albus]
MMSVLAQTSVAGLFSEETEPTEDHKLTLVASIPPLKMLLDDLVGDKATIELISQNGSPHHKVMRPSDVAKLNSADMIVWVGPELEQYLVRFVGRYAGKTLSMIETASDEALHHFDNVHHSEHVHQHHDHDQHSTLDPHLWLNPLAVKETGKAIIERISQLDAANASFYQTRYQALVDAIDTSIVVWQKQLMPLKGKAYFVYHDAYGYLESTLGIESLAVLTVNPGVKPSAKKLGQLAQQLKGVEAACVFYEPEFQQIRLDRVTDARLEYYLLNPLGVVGEQSASGRLHYIEFMARLVDGFGECLSRLP